MTGTQSITDPVVESEDGRDQRPAILRMITPTVAAYLAAVALLLLGGVLHPGFLTSTHLSTMMALISVLGVVAAGQTVVIVTGGIDLSVAATLTFAEVMTAFWSQGQTGRWPFLLLIVCVSVVIGLINAAGITVLKIEPLIMTLGVGAAVSGAVLVLTNGSSTGRPPKFLADAMTRGGWLSGLLLLWLVASIVTYLMLHRSRFGRQMFAIGTNVRAARLAGVSASSTLVGVYVFTSVMAALAGIALAGYTGSGDFGVGDTYLFPSIGAVVIGGTSILGGRGSYIGTIAGIVILGTIDSILTLSNIAAAGRQIATGLAILVVLVLYARERRLRQ
ncbi:MAG TPA: ABC transporter permease [Streptosporangiaceae bacterium]|nr:ABC transporter permease [Streptosporangiaceae bacterium]